jgi:hypothetical protein
MPPTPRRKPARRSAPRPSASRPARPPVELLTLANAKRAGVLAAAALLLAHAREPEAVPVAIQLTFFIHEAGHALFRWLPEFGYIAAGSVFQCVLPVGAIASAAWRRAPFLAGLGGCWLASNLFYVAQYARDAVDMELPIQGEIHDWNYLLDAMGRFDAAGRIADGLVAFGGLTLVASAIAVLLLATDEV